MRMKTLLLNLVIAQNSGFLDVVLMVLAQWRRVMMSIESSNE
jgi:hypothetical protein